MTNNADTLDKEGCEYGRMLAKDVKYIKGELTEIVDKLKNRPSWPVAVTIIVMTNLVVGLAIAFIVGG